MKQEDFSKRRIFCIFLVGLLQISNCQITTKRLSNITTGILPNNHNIIKSTITAQSYTKTLAEYATPLFEEINSAPIESSNTNNPTQNTNTSTNTNENTNGNVNGTVNTNNLNTNNTNNINPNATNKASGNSNENTTTNTNLNVNGNSTDPNSNNSQPSVNGNPFLNNTTNTDPYLNNTVIVDYDKNTNWTSGYGTHYGPFPSQPHFSEIGYQPNDVGVGCSDGRPGGDPNWNKILEKGVYPSPNLVNHENTVWPVTYTVAVSLAVWNKEDVCWKTIKIRNKKKPEYVIEAHIVDFCPIGHCQWSDKYLARNVDIYGEKAWFALGADSNDSKLEIEIEWPKGVVPHDAISGFSKMNISIITLIASLLFTFTILFS